MSKGTAKAQACDLAKARTRLRQAESFVETADLVLHMSSDDDVATPGVAASLAVLAGIAASDAACCAKLKLRPKGQRHFDAVPTLAKVAPNGPEMSKDLKRLLQRKDAAQYGLGLVSSGDASRMVDWAKRMVAKAHEVLDSA